MTRTPLPCALPGRQLCANGVDSFSTIKPGFNVTKLILILTATIGLVLDVGCLAESRMAGVGNRWDFVPGWADVRSSGRVGGTNRAKRW